MTRYKLLLAFLAALLVPLALACGDDDNGGGNTPTATSPTAVFSCDNPPRATAPDTAAFPVTLLDDNGDSITLGKAPTAIASLSAGHTESLFAMGAGDQVKVVDKTSNCPKATSDLAQVDAFSPSVEAIAGLQPDLVILFYDPGDLASSLRALDIPVLFLKAPDTVQGVFQQMNILGRATGHERQAVDLAQSMRTQISVITARIIGLRPPTVYHEVDVNYFSAGPGSFVGDLYSLLNATNIADATGQAYPQLSAEAIIAANPDVIILADEGAGETPDTVANRPGWSQINAVKNNRIYIVNADIVSRPGPRLVDALEALANDIYPLTP